MSAKNGGLIAACVVMLTGLLLVAPLVPLNAQDDRKPVQWQVGDTWTVKLTQMAQQMMSEQPAFVDRGRWKFRVKDIKEGNYIVDVEDIARPSSAEKWSLRLVYDRYGDLVDARYQVGTRVFRKDAALLYLPLDEFGLSMNRRKEALESGVTVKALDARTGNQETFLQVKSLDEKSAQTWRRGEPWWRAYESKKGVPVKATLVDCSEWDNE